MFNPRIFCSLVLLALLSSMTAQTDIAAMIERFKEEPRGPYRDIAWFCNDGSVVPSVSGGCASPHEGNKQHARYKQEVIELGRKNHIFLAQILTDTDIKQFWDAENDHSRLKQYQLGNYLAAIDDGWVNRTGQYYRGAFQIEDEMEWGREFLNWLMGQEEAVRKNFYLARQAVNGIPHRKDDDLTQKIRNDSKVIADKYPKFMDLRIKIHGQPEGKDAEAVSKFLENNRSELEKRKLTGMMETLAKDIRTAYVDRDLIADILAINKTVPEKNGLKDQINRFAEQHAMDPGNDEGNVIDRLTAAADLMYDIRTGIWNETPYYRLEMMDISLALEQLIFSTAAKWEPTDTRELTEKICYLAKATAGAGFVEEWEYQQAITGFGDPNYQYVLPQTMTNYLDNARRYVEWGTSTNRAVYGEVVALYAEFEPKAYGFLDNMIRGSVLLPLGDAVGELGNWVARNGNLNNAMLDVPNQGQIRGLNPGYTRGVLHVIEGTPEDPEVNQNDIYIFAVPPADLKPVGGIATVSEGNMVSHVQLLARNLGIPNAVITDDQFARLKKYDGDEVFYAVSNGGTAIMKPVKDMTEVEKELFAVKERSTERIEVPVENIRLDVRRVLNMREVRSKDSGKLCGPKAANLGQLKALFPDKVVEGLVIPFGIFRGHLDQPMPDQPGVSYWQFLNDRFGIAKQMEKDGRSVEEVQRYSLEQLETLREAIGDIRLERKLVEALQDSFQRVFGAPLGEVPVFLRSDTNMEDLADFTGAGLNKTVFNVVDEQGILDGIRAVWASPYTERSYKWRQSYLLNPENVFPSILIIPSVDVDYSGVMITKGVSSGIEDDITVAFSRGAGGAVDGQAAEAYIMNAGGTPTLLSPARERLHRRLPKSGGSVMVPAGFDERVLSEKNLKDLYDLAREVEKVMPESDGVTGNGPWDVELGFQDDKIWLFQIRPFVENSNAQASEYLESISPEKMPEGTYLDLSK
ncbi:phosphoenolpyruvate synthase [Lewinellaceae bacterium SD302]|nr:phosphoenolpyruvate synthase [Lewinellaceae bacterium SD302]